MTWLSEVDRQIRRRLAQIRLPFVGVIKRTGQAPQVAGLNGELFPDTPHVQHVGIASGLPLDAEVVMLPLMGKTARVVIVGSRGGLTVDVAEGEMCIYDQFGHKVHLTQNGILMVGDVVVQGALQATSVSDNKGSMDAMRVIFDGHGVHVTPDGLPTTKMGGGSNGST